MSREIKFREWDSVREEFMPGHGLSYSHREDYDDEVGFRFEHMESDEDWVDGHRVLEQFTELEDKNGRDIYEGDIVKIRSSMRPEDFTGIVEFVNGGFYVAGKGAHVDKYVSLAEVIPFTDIDSDDTYQVIGNIHENKDLLEDEK